MSTDLHPLHIRRVLGTRDYLPPQPFGPDGWSFMQKDQGGSVIVTCAHVDGAEWVHASVAHTTRLPSYDELKQLHLAVWRGRGFAYQVFARSSDHVNIHEYALHLWGRLDGAPALPSFAVGGSI